MPYLRNKYFYFNALLVIVSVFFSSINTASERHYTLTISTASLNIGGTIAQAMLVNGTLPGPVLEFTEGETAVIRVKNALSKDASIHWHGLLLPQDQDGVPYLTSLPIPAGGEFTYRFPITHAGTYWYHSHTDIDEQRGQYGAIVIHPAQQDTRNYQHDVVVQLSDWTHEDPARVLRNLKKDGDWYRFKKDSVVSIAGYLRENALAAWLKNRWQGMEGMDISDVGYDAFLANGKPMATVAQSAKSGEKVRLRLINSGASSYFSIGLGEGSMQVIAADGIDVQPIAVKSITMGMAETYDVIVTVPESGALQLTANNIDGTGGASIVVGDGEFQAAPQPVRPNLYQAMDHGEHSKHGNHHHAKHKRAMRGELLDSTVREALQYSMLKTLEPVRYEGELRDVQLDLTGNMHSYSWSFNQIPLSRADKILINKGEVVRFIFNNKTMMRHPLHLHGHFFKVISGNGDYDVLKHTVDVGPMATVVIEFKANAEKDWLFHCHNLYHAKTGMARVVRYSDYLGNPRFMAAKKKSKDIADSDWYTRGDLGVYNQLLDGRWVASNQRFVIGGEAERADWQHSEASAWVGLKTSPQNYLFARYEYERNEAIEWQYGLAYTLPFQVDAEIWVTDEADVAVAVESEFQLSKYVAIDAGGDSDEDWHVAVAFRNSPRWALQLKTQQNVDIAIGAELTF